MPILNPPDWLLVNWCLRQQPNVNLGSRHLRNLSIRSSLVPGFSFLIILCTPYVLRTFKQSLQFDILVLWRMITCVAISPPLPSQFPPRHHASHPADSARISKLFYETTSQPSLSSSALLELIRFNTVWVALRWLLMFIPLFPTMPLSPTLQRALQTLCTRFVYPAGQIHRL